jgi:hypothetical protein
MSVVVSGGAKLEAALRTLAAKVASPGTLRVGVLEKSRYPDGTPVAMIAAIQDFGAPAAGIPPRPFMRNAIAEHKAEWPKALGDLLKDNDYQTKPALEKFGQGVAGQIRQSIIDTNQPPLKPATIRRKGFEKPLVDTGQLLASIDYEVKTG